jgi:hypothetical protein
LEQNKESQSRVGESLLETSDGASTLLETDSILLHPRMCEEPLVGREPASGKRMVREQEDSGDGYCHSHDTCTLASSSCASR